MDTQKQIEPVSGARRARARVPRNCDPECSHAFFYAPSLPALLHPSLRLSRRALSNCINSSSLEPITEPAIFGFHFHGSFSLFFSFRYIRSNHVDTRNAGTIMDRSIEKMSSRPLIIRPIFFFLFFFHRIAAERKGKCTDLRIEARI